MRTIIINSSLPCIYSKHFTLIIGFKNYNLGLQIEKKYFRIMLIWWHVCFSF